MFLFDFELVLHIETLKHQIHDFLEKSGIDFYITNKSQLIQF